MKYKNKTNKRTIRSKHFIQFGEDEATKLNELTQIETLIREDVFDKEVFVQLIYIFSQENCS